MKNICLFCFYILHPYLLYSQQDNSIERIIRSKAVFETSTKFYLENTSLKKHFIKQYYGLTKSYKPFTFLHYKKRKRLLSRDTLYAKHQLLKLSQLPQNAFPILMTARLKWEFQEHLQKEYLYSAKYYCRNKQDSAFYFFTLGLFYKDSINEILSRKLGFVSSKNDGNELVDWQKINHVKISKWDLEYITPGINSIDMTITDIENAFIPFFEKAIESDKTEFFYMIELLLPLIRFEDEQMVQQMIIKYRENYTLYEQIWLDVRMNESKLREKTKPPVKNIETLH